MKNTVREKDVWEGKPRRRDIRMIALDLDGTALNKEMKVTERTAEALEEAARRGIQVIIATGRNRRSEVRRHIKRRCDKRTEDGESHLQKLYPGCGGGTGG